MDGIAIISKLKLTLQWAYPPQPQSQTVDGLATRKFNHVISSPRLFMNTLIIVILYILFTGYRRVLPVIGVIDSLHSRRHVFIQWRTQFKKIIFGQWSIMKTSSQCHLRWEMGDYQTWSSQINWMAHTDDFKRER